jgi:tRNA pseudouridine38-40 synthase
MPRFRATQRYDGTAYQGFQRQAPGRPSIQAAVEQAVTEVTGQNAVVIGAGRTDTGVHATGQVITFAVEWAHEDDALLRALNVTLPEDIALSELRRLNEDDDFHPRYSARARVYNYTVLQAEVRHPLWRGRAWQVRDALDGEAMNAAAALLIGTHDCATFGTPPKGDDTVRTIFRSAWTWHADEAGHLWQYEIAANAFLYRMVRRIVGMLVDVGRGRRTVSQFEADFRLARLTPRWTIAPPQGLVLTRVIYPDDRDAEAF